MAPHVKPKDVCATRSWPGLRESGPAGVAADFGIHGVSAEIQSCFRLAKLYAQCLAPVSLRGATGTGKEVFARAIHYLGRRAAGAFVPVNCGALPEALFESELFGVVKGAYTGAQADRQGLVELARGGTLFLDEIDCLPGKSQAALLRFLQEQEYRPVGGGKPRRADVRIITATNANLETQVAAGQFRDDLLFRLDVCVIVLPSLNDRSSDVPHLARHFLETLAARYGAPVPDLTPEAAAWLESRHWQGNLRQLENILHRALIVCGGDIDMPLLAGIMPSLGQSASGGAAACSVLDEGPLVEARRRAAFRFEERYLRELIAATGGNVTEAARRAGTERRAMGRMLKRHGLGR